MSTNTLTIDLNEEYKVKIEQPSDLASSYFKDIYLDAGIATADILKKSEEAKDKESKGKDNPFKRQGEEYNNVIAFCGERGTGKSSAMISFAQSLFRISECEEFYKTENSESSYLKGYKFHSLEIIDPSMFEDNEHIFEVILSQLFSSFTKELSENKKTDQDKKREVLELFQKVYENLKTVQKNGEKEKYNGEALETLSKLACGANLRNNFSKLVQEYLTFITPCKDDRPCLIIPIDDFDLNVKAVAVMAEQIRKYLMIPNVIILMAADMKQLSDAKEQSVRKDFETLIEADVMSESPKSITAKYILKLIPDQRRLVLPFIQDSNVTIDVTIKEKGKLVFYWETEKDEKGFRKRKTKKDSKGNDVWIQKEEHLDDIFMRLCYQNYHILFVKPKTGVHPIIPNNIRELKEWLLFLTTPPSDLDPKIALNAFNDRFINAYCENYLEESDVKLIRVLNNTTSDLLHKKIVEEVISLFKGDNINISNEYQYIIGDDGDGINISKEEGNIYRNSLIREFKTIIKRSNYSFNISLGDIMLFLDVVERYHNTGRIKKLVFAIKTLISLRLKKGIISFGKNKDEFNSILGGSYVNFKNVKLLPKGREEFSFAYSDTNLITSDDNNKRIASDSKMFEWIHYFIPLFGRDEYRSSLSTRYYAVEYNHKYANFDLLAPLFYIVNPELVKKRVKPLVKEFNVKKDNWEDEIQNHTFESVELLEYIFGDFNYSLKDQILNVFALFYHPYKEILDKIEGFKKEYSYYDIELEKLVLKNPIIRILSESASINDTISSTDGTTTILKELLNAYSLLNNQSLEKDASKENSQSGENLNLAKDNSKKINDFIKDRLSKLKYGLKPKDFVGLSGNTVRPRIGNDLTGYKGLSTISHYHPKINDLRDEINRYKLKIDANGYFREEELEKIYDDIVQIITVWKINNKLDD